MKKALRRYQKYFVEHDMPQGGLINFTFEDGPVKIINNYKITRQNIFSVFYNKKRFNDTMYYTFREQRIKVKTSEKTGPVKLSAYYSNDNLFEVDIVLSQDHGPCDINPETLSELEKILGLQLIKNDNQISGCERFIILDERSDLIQGDISKKIIDAWEHVRNNITPTDYLVINDQPQRSLR